MDKAETIEKWLREYEEKNGFELDAHNKGVLRQMLSREYEHWEREEGRVLKDSNRYHDDN